MKLRTLLDAAAPVSVTGAANQDVTGVACDSRKVRPGFVFVAIPGEQHDGSAFIGEAVARGAVAVVSEGDSGDVQNGVVAAVVEDSHAALARVAAVFHGIPAKQLQVIGVTGTNGKTSVSYIARDILRAAGREPGLIGTVEYQIGARTIPASRTTPDASVLQSFLSQMVASGCRSVCMEVSSHALVQRRTLGIAFDVAVFTNLSRDHLDYHRTMEEYFEAKRSLFSGLSLQEKSATAVVSIDDEWGRRLVPRVDPAVRVLTFGTNPSADVAAESVELDARGSRFRAVTPWGAFSVETPLLGTYNVQNVLAAVAACGSLGVDVEIMAGALPAVTAVPGRLEAVPVERGFEVFVDYAHTDDALANVLRALKPVTERRLLVLFGCGGDRDRTKRPAMGRAAAAYADYVVVTSDNPRTEDPQAIINDILPGLDAHCNYEVLVDRSEGIARVLQLAEPGDVVLIAGKGHERFQEFANTTVPFDDRRVALAALGEVD
jgi:UDP-N-acetylmuramoyl-L-alanyl-D-glutamate--2,6-diaminopimelate ligase